MSQPEPVEEFDVGVEETDRGWLVVGTVDGERRVFGDPHPDRETAEFHAKSISAGAEMWDGGAKVED